MFLGRCNNAIISDRVQGTSKNISYLFDFDRRHRAGFLSVVTLGANRWRMHPAFRKIFALRHEKGKTLYTVAFQPPFNKSGTDTGSLWAGVRWSLVRGKTLHTNVTHSVTALSGVGVDSRDTGNTGHEYTLDGTPVHHRASKI